MSTDKKRAQTSYGSVEYDTLQCAECTNETVTSEITHLYVIDDRPDATEVENRSIIVYPVCHGCIVETYGGDEEIDVLDHDVLCRFYTEHWDSESGAQLITGVPETTTTSAATIHGNVDVDVAHCSRCEGEWTIDDLRAAYVPLAMVNDELHTGTRLYCPDCRELYVTTVEGTGPNYSQVVATAGEALREDQEDTEDSPLKQAIVLFAGGTLVSIIGAAIHPVIGSLLILATCAMAGYALYRHFAGLGPIHNQEEN